MDEHIYARGSLVKVGPFDSETLDEAIIRILKEENIECDISIYKDWKEVVNEELFETHIIINDIIYIVNFDYLEPDDIFLAYKTKDKKIKFLINYDNDSDLTLEDALTVAINRMNINDN